MNHGAVIRILVVDDHTLFRRGLTALLREDRRFCVVGEAGDASEAHRHAQQMQPDLILLDNHLPGVNGVDALAGLKEVAPRAKVLILTVGEDERDLAAALRAGASGYLLKTVDSDELADSIVRAVAGESVVSPQMTGKLVSAFQSLQSRTAEVDSVPGEDEHADPIRSLSPREHEILVCIARGESNKEIARTLDIAPTTVKIHVQHILRKLNLSSRVQAAVYATQRVS